MATDKGFKKMRELIAALAEAERSMEEGTLGHEGLEQATIHARELYERLVILRHRSREAKISGRSSAAQKDISPETLAKEMKSIANVASEPAPPPMRLDTRPQEISPRQTSLIEAIEASEGTPEEKAEKIASIKENDGNGKPAAEAAKGTAKEPSRPEPEPEPKPEPEPEPKPAPGVAQERVVEKEPEQSEVQGTRSSGQPASLAEKLNKASIPSLGKAISLSHKFWFVSELYNGDRIFYEKSIDMLDGMDGRAEAELFVQKEVIARLKKPADPEALNTFMELIERRFQ